MPSAQLVDRISVEDLTSRYPGAHDLDLHLMLIEVLEKVAGNLVLSVEKVAKNLFLHLKKRLRVWYNSGRKQ